MCYRSLMPHDTQCCAPVTDESLTPDRADDLASVFKALGDPTRLRLLSMIAASPTGEVCACDLPDPVDRSQATVSHHLSVLTRAGLIGRDQRGKWAWFRVAPEHHDFVRSILDRETAPA